MRKNFLLWIAWLAPAVIPTIAFAGIGMITGNERGVWTDIDGRYAVVLGKLTDVEKGRGPNEWAARFSPLMTLAGVFDPTERTGIPVSFYVEMRTSSVRELPPKGHEGSLVIAVLGIHDKEQGNTKTFIVSDICTFMPDGSSLVVITGLDDPELVETIKKVQDGRLQPIPNMVIPSRSPTTRPATVAPKVVAPKVPTP